MTVTTALPTRTAILYKYWGEPRAPGTQHPWYTIETFTGTEGDFIRKYAEGWTTTQPEDYAARPR